MPDRLCLAPRKKRRVNSKQLRMGIRVEKEHTSNSRIAEQIARDHLYEIPDYYTRLMKMEKEARR